MEVVKELVYLVGQDEMYSCQDSLERIVHDPLVEGLLREGLHSLAD
jgi:hypothetical protein